MTGASRHLKRIIIWLGGLLAVLAIGLFTMCAIAAAGLLCTDLSVMNSGQNSLAWPSTRATVREIGLKRESSITGQRVTYDYQVDTKSYSSSRIAFRLDSSKEPRVDAKPGGTITVFYNPASPAESVIFPGTDPGIGLSIATNLTAIVVLSALIYLTLFHSRNLVFGISSGFLAELNLLFLWATAKTKKDTTSGGKSGSSQIHIENKGPSDLEERARNWQLVFTSVLTLGFIYVMIASSQNTISGELAGNLTVFLLYGPAGMTGAAYLMPRAIKAIFSKEETGSKHKKKKHSHGERLGLFEYILCAGSKGNYSIKASFKLASAAALGLILMSFCGISSYWLLSKHGNFSDALFWSLIASVIGYFWVPMFDLEGIARTPRFKMAMGSFLILASLSFFIWSPLAPQNAAAFDHYKRALALEDKQPVQAIEELDKAIAAKQRFYEAYYHRGFLNYTIGNDQSALDDFNEAIKLEPKLSASYFYRGRIREKMGQLDKALSNYDRAIDLWGREGEYFYRRAQLEEKMGNQSLASADFSKAAALGYKPDATDSK